MQNDADGQETQASRNEGFSTGTGADQASTVNVAPLRAPVPAGSVALSLPVSAPAGTRALTCVAPTCSRDGWSAPPPKVTFVAYWRFVPVIVTSAPAAPCVGVKEVTVGGNTTVNTP